MTAMQAVIGTTTHTSSINLPIPPTADLVGLSAQLSASINAVL